MKTDKENLLLNSRHIHTKEGNGSTISIFRDIIKSNKAILKIELKSTDAAKSEMTIKGNDKKGLSSHQLRDIALMFLEAAYQLDLPNTGKEEQYFENNVSSIVDTNGNERQGVQPKSIELSLQERTHLGLSNENFCERYKILSKHKQSTIIKERIEELIKKML